MNCNNSDSFRGIIKGAILGAVLWSAGVSCAIAATLIQNVTVLPMTGQGPQPGWSVLVDGDRIVAAGPLADITAPIDAERIDGAGGVLAPGLIDMHVHLDAVKTEVGPERDLALYAAHGVTTIRVMWGRDGHLALRDQIASGERFAPSLVLAGPGFGRTAKPPAELAAMVARQAEAGWDLIKVHWKPTSGQFDAIMTAAKDAGIEVAGHVPYAVSLDRALASGMRSIEHMDGYIRDMAAEGTPVSGDALANAVAKTKAAGVAVVPTMFGWRLHLRAAQLDEMLALEELVYMPPGAIANWKSHYTASLVDGAKSWFKALIGEHDPYVIAANRAHLLKAFADGGVPVLFGTDAGLHINVPGASALREMKEMKAAGLSNLEIVKSATAAAGRFMDPQGRLGVIAVGARADLVLLPSNPLDDLSAYDEPQGVMLRGQWYPKADLEAAKTRWRKAAGN